jgi:RNA polymerase sigma factor for flagellar operon FliA
VILYYYEDLTMKEIGETLDISESRVSQLHSLLVKRIRSVMEAWELE